jgi:hypothetical protein
MCEVSDISFRHDPRPSTSKSNISFVFILKRRKLASRNDQGLVQSREYFIHIPTGQLSFLVQSPSVRGLARLFLKQSESWNAEIQLEPIM